MEDEDFNQHNQIDEFKRPSDIKWGSAKTNEHGVVTKTAECGCEIMSGGGPGYLVNSCSIQHDVAIHARIAAWAELRKLIENGVDE